MRIARQTGWSIGKAARWLDLFERRGLLDRTTRGRVWRAA
jgi:hypothetical protein